MVQFIVVGNRRINLDYVVSVTIQDNGGLCFHMRDELIFATPQEAEPLRAWFGPYDLTKHTPVYGIGCGS